MLREWLDTAVREVSKPPLWIWPLIGVSAMLLGACEESDTAGEVGRLLLSNAPGILTAAAVAIRANGKIRISDAERDRIAAQAHAESVSAMASTMKAMRADLDTAQSAAQDALRREREAREHAKKLDQRCDALQRELNDVLRVLRAGGIPVGG